MSAPPTTRSAVIVAVLAIALLLAPHALAAGTPGPFVGAVAQGQTKSHGFSSPPPRIECILPVWWTVTLSYAPATDTLTLWANGFSATGSNGRASVSWEGACWDQFGISVTGTSVAVVAVYEVGVGHNSAPPA